MRRRVSHKTLLRMLARNKRALWEADSLLEGRHPVKGVVRDWEGERADFDAVMARATMHADRLRALEKNREGFSGLGFKGYGIGSRKRTMVRRSR